MLCTMYQPHASYFFFIITHDSSYNDRVHDHFLAWPKGMQCGDLFFGIIPSSWNGAERWFICTSNANLHNYTNIMYLMLQIIIKSANVIKGNGVL